MYWPKLDELDEDRVTNAYTIIAQMIEEKCPDLNARRGVVGDLVVELHAILQGAGMQMVEDFRRSISAQELATDPRNALPGAVDLLAANFGVERKISTKARGDITVILRRPDGSSFGRNTTFMCRGKRFYVEQTVAVKPPGTQKKSRHDVACVELDNGNFAVQVPVIAEKLSEETMLRRFDKLTPEVRPPHFEMAYATTDFVGGAVPQSNAELVRQMKAGRAAPGFSGPENVKALVRASSADVLDAAVIGACDAEMRRDQRDGVVSRGGKLDIYLKSRTYPACVGLVKTATLVEKTEEGVIWQVEIDRNDAPGFYEVRDIRPVGTDPRDPGCKLIKDSRTLDTVGFDYVPDVQGDECYLSRYQQSTVTFEEITDELGLVVGDEKEVEISVLYMPGVDVVQDYVNDPEVRQPGLDVLVRAATPAWIMVDITCKRDNPVDPDAACEALQAYVNNLQIGVKPSQYTMVGVLPDPDAVVDIRVGGLRDFDATSAAFLSPSGVIINFED